MQAKLDIWYFILDKIELNLYISKLMIMILNFLCLTINENMNPKSHIYKISNWSSTGMGILNKLKHFLPLNAKLMIYNSLILSHLNFGILFWGYRCNRIIKLQKRIVQIISLSKYNAHTEPIFKMLKLLKISAILSALNSKIVNCFTIL